ncbi:MAG: hypothetical protein ABEI77_01165 [Halorientalis sp.]
MAHLTDDDRSRGQIILVTGFALAVSFVALALVLNSVIYTENLATRSESAKASDAVTAKSDMVEATEAIIKYVNDHNASGASSYDPLREQVQLGVNNTTQYARRFRVVSGQAVNATLVATDEGTWINQSHTERNFTDAQGNTTWTLVNDTTGVRRFSMNLTDLSKLADKSDSTEQNFTVAVRNQSASPKTWTLAVFHDDTKGTYNVSVATGGTYQSHCNVTASSVTHFWVNVTQGTVNGTSCRPLRFAAGMGSTYDVSYLHSDNVFGTYQLLVNKTIGDVRSTDDTTYNATGALKPPITDRAIYGAKLLVAYQSQHVEYQTDAQVHPGENDD